MAYPFKATGKRPIANVGMGPYKTARTASSLCIDCEVRKCARVFSGGRFTNGYRKRCARCERIRRLYKDLPPLSELLKRQNGRCAVCSQCLQDNDTTIDHDHVTGKVRELLCNKCNRIMGASGDSVPRLKLCVAYLEKHGSS